MLLPEAQLEIFLDALSGWSGEKKEFSLEPNIPPGGIIKTGVLRNMIWKIIRTIQKT